MGENSSVGVVAPRGADERGAGNFCAKAAQPGRVRIDRYQAADWPAIRRLIDEHWRGGHPLTQRALFEWQYQGCASAARSSCPCRVIRAGGDVVGFLGAIPTDYFIGTETRAGAAIGLWFVRPEWRSTGLGALAFRELLNEFEVHCCLGINPAVVPMYRRCGFQVVPALRRWIRVMRPERLAELTDGGARAIAGDFDHADGAPPAAPCASWPCDELADVAARTLPTVFHLGVLRSAAYWRWRYAESVGFGYRLFRDVAGNAVVARLESILAPQKPSLTGQLVLRVIEILPAAAAVWRGAADPALLALLHGVLAWAGRTGAILADYQCSSARLGALLATAGFAEQAPDGLAAVRAVPHLFQPLRPVAAPINFAYRVAHAQTALDPDDVYFVKSDGDMDRPNISPPPAPAPRSRSC